MLEWGILHDLFSTAINLIYLAVVIGTVIVVLLDNRNPVKTLSWVLVFIFVPLIGLVFYYFFGQKNRKERLISRKVFTRLYRRPMEEFQAQESFKTPEDKYQLIHFFQRINKALPFSRNRTEFYTDGYAMITSLLREISQAKHHIHVEFFKFEDDPIGRLVRDALIDKVREGVEVRLLYDDVGCWRVDRMFYDNMMAEGIDVQGFLKVRFPLFTSKVNYRNHRKIVVIDGKVGFVGGMNIAKRYLQGIHGGVWRDTHMKISGRAVYGLQTIFLADWYAMDQTLISSSRYFPRISPEGISLMQVVTSDPVGSSRNIMQGLLVAITNARSYFYIQTPYFLPNEAIQISLKTAALAGVDVRIMMPREADTVLTHLASFSYLEDMMEAGVKIYFYEAGFLHSKLMVSDDSFSTVGTTNLDFRSLEYNFEVNAVMYDRSSALACKAMFQNDMECATLLTLEEWRARPWYQRLSESILRLFSPLL